jgi:catechol 2,3-dioxygenase-like lactoylglutathione lyase family enzyme
VAVRLQHVSSPFPPDRHEDVRRFYGAAVGLREIAVPLTLDQHRFIWFAAGPDSLELHFFVGTPDPAHRRHLCLVVDDLDATRHRLVETGYAPDEADPIPNRPRFFCRDPFGNLVEFTTILGRYDT